MESHPLLSDKVTRIDIVKFQKTISIKREKKLYLYVYNKYLWRIHVNFKKFSEYIKRTSCSNGIQHYYTQTKTDLRNP